MPLKLLLFSLGVLAVSYFPYLPPLRCLLVLPVLFCCIRWRIGRSFFVLSLGLAWGIYAGHRMLALQLDDDLAGKDLVVMGQIQGVPEQNNHRLGFNLRITSATTSTGQAIALEHFPARIKLSWYQYQRNKAKVHLPQLNIGDLWQLRVRLKRPRGFVNPAGFDYQAWLLRKGIGATGYVIEHPTNQRQELAQENFHWDDWIDKQRYDLQRWVVSHNDSSERGILVALLIGDSALVNKDQWLRMQQTGTSHLIAISGMHVGFLALFGFYVGLWFGKCIQLVWHRCPALILAWISAILCASFYSALAGFNIPTVRTFIMLSLFYAACLWGRSVRVSDIYCVALALVVVIDPLAVLDMGFWLSFGAVALLLICFSGRLTIKTQLEPWSGFQAIHLLQGFIQSQWVMFVGLLLPLGLLVNTISLAAPVANFIAIPLITFFVVPLLLIGAATRNLFENLSNLLLAGAGWAMEILKSFLVSLLNIGGAFSSPVIAFHSWLLLLIGLSCCVLLLPKGLFPRVLGWGGLLLSAALQWLVTPPNLTVLKLTVLDVGQGTAVVVQVGDKTLVYDAGPKYTDSFNAGSGIVAPYLFSQGITRVDRLVVSHADMDHAGGVPGLLERLSVNQILAGEPERSSNQFTSRNCHEIPNWQWQSVNFQFLDFAQSSNASANNHSCVLLISYGDEHILLPGDIESTVESQLLRAGALPEKISLLLAAHHGSRTSSSPAFVQYTKPSIVIYSAGFRNHHGHPHKNIRQRFETIGSREINTAEAGAVVVEWGQNRLQNIQEYRRTHRRYWFD
jgi:competence protein ComEC